VRRAKLYYLRGRVGRRARVRERQFTGPAARTAAGQADAPPELLEDVGGATDSEGVSVAEAEVAAPEAPADSTADTAADAETPQAEGDASATAEGAGDAGGDAQGDAAGTDAGDSDARDS
jgi:large subunit ribosomal protein L19